MTIEAAIRTKLLSVSGIATLVGTRIFSVSIPQGTPVPCICLTQISGESYVVHGRALQVQSVEFEVSCFAVEPVAGKVLARLVRNALNGWRGVSEGVKVGVCRVINQSDLSEDFASSHIPINVLLSYQEVGTG